MCFDNAVVRIAFHTSKSEADEVYVLRHQQVPESHFAPTDAPPFMTPNLLYALNGVWTIPAFK